MPPGNDSLAADTSLGTVESYGGGGARPWHRQPPVALVAVVLWIASAAGRWTPALAAPRILTVCLALLVVRVRTRWSGVLLVVVLGIAGGAREWSVTQVRAGECGGTARVLTDPVSFGASASAVVDLGGMRVRASAHGPQSARVSRLSAGQVVEVRGTCAPVRGPRVARELVNHVRGRMAVSEVSEFPSDGGGLWRAANRVRTVFLHGTRTMDADDAALFAGLVIGDDSRQPREMIDQFRGSGLSHLCSVSGQNVAFVMAAFSPLLRRLRPLARLLATLAVITWFVFLTRAEPSILRASVMASVVALNFFRGRTLNGRAVLCVSVCVLLVADPFLAFSVGFMLSAGATAGLAWFSGPLSRWLRLPGVVTATVAAQMGTLPVAVLVFGRLPLVSLVANPLAVPVAGFVMLLGVPVALLAGVLPLAPATVLGMSMAVPTRYVATVARLCAGAEPHGIAALVCWLILACLVALRVRRHPSVAG